jgi:hypothetical protein
MDVAAAARAEGRHRSFVKIREKGEEVEQRVLAGRPRYHGRHG